MKCPQCQNEFPETNEAVQLCPFCGTAANATNFYQPEPAVVRPDFPMKWYKFLIYFALFASAVLNALSGIGQMLGTVYSNQEIASAVYAQYPALRPVDIVYGLLLIGLAAFAIVTRQQLANYKEKAPLFLYAMYGSTIVLSVFYLIATSLVMQSMDFTITAVVESLPSLISSAVVLVLNIVYFQKRKVLFDR